MEGLIPLVYRAIVEYRQARQAAVGSFLQFGDQPPSSSLSSSGALFVCNPGWCAASPPARTSLVSPLLRPPAASRRHVAG
jgi:hypothetical protein